MMENYSLSDIRAVTEGENGMGGNGFFWIILLAILFLPMMGGANGGLFGHNGATAAAQQEILYGQQFQGIHNKLDAIGQGICDSTYAVTGAVTGEGRAIQTQLAECCCEQRVGMQKLENKIDNMFKDAEIRSLYSRVNSLERDASLCGVVRYPTQMSYCSPCNPFCGNQNPCGGYGYGCGNGF